MNGKLTPKIGIAVIHLGPLYLLLVLQNGRRMEVVLLWRGTVRCGTVRCGTVRYGTVRYGTVQYSTVWYGMVQYRMVQ